MEGLVSEVLASIDDLPWRHLYLRPRSVRLRALIKPITDHTLGLEGLAVIRHVSP